MRKGSETIECEHSERRRRVYPKLYGNIFHATSLEAFREISAAGNIQYHRGYEGLPGKLPQYGPNHGLVCLHDFRNMDATKIGDFLDKYSLNKEVYLFIDPSVWPRLIPNQEAYCERNRTGRWELFIPDFEVWYPGDLPLRHVRRRLTVKVQSGENESAFIPQLLKNS